MEELVQSKAKQTTLQKQVLAANDVWSHARITVTKPGSIDETTALWFQAENLKEYIQRFEGCGAGVPVCVTYLPVRSAKNYKLASPKKKKDDKKIE